MKQVADKKELHRELCKLDIWLNSTGGRQTLIESQEKAEETATTIVSDTTVDSKIMEIMFDL